MSTNRKMRNLCRIAFMLAACTALTFMTSCKKEEVRDQGATIPDEVINRLQVIGLGTDDIQVDPEGGYLVEGCLHMTEEQIFEQFTDLTVDGGTELEQYRTYNLVSVPGSTRTIRVRGSTNLSTKMSNALNTAIAQYNSEGLKLVFQRVTSGSYDILVRRNGTSTGASAGFPTSGGNPYNTVNLGSGLNNIQENTVARVIMHEMGHCIGFRHTDWFNRSLSCGTGGSEGADPYGAVNIPGTPTGNDASSVMRACFSNGQAPTWSNYDRTALNYLY